MSQDVLHFQCSACHSALTVPIQLAGVTGPCPKCGATVTSPLAPPAPPPAAPPSQMPMQVPVPPMPAMGPAGGQPPFPPAEPPPPPPAPAGIMHPGGPPLFPPQAPQQQSPLMPPMMAQPAQVPPQPPFPPQPPMVGGWGMPEMQQLQAHVPPPASPVPPPVAVPPQLEQLLQPRTSGPLPAPMPSMASLPGGAVPTQNEPGLPGGGLLPARRLEGQFPAGGSLMNQSGIGGFGPPVGEAAAPSATPQWNLPGANVPPPMQRPSAEDPMATILRGTNPPPSPLPQQIGSELDDGPRRPQAQPPAAHAFPPQASAAAPAAMPPQAVNVRLGGAKRGKGRLVGAIAALLLLGALGGVAWHFKEPLGEIAQRYVKSKKPADAAASDFSAKPNDAAAETAAAGSQNQAPTAPGGGFDPDAKPSETDAARKNATPLPGDGKPAAPHAMGAANPSGAAASPDATTRPVVKAGSAILGTSAPKPPPTEIKPAGAPDGGPAVSSMSAVPKAAVVDESAVPAAIPADEKTPGNGLLPPLVEVTPKSAGAADATGAKGMVSSNAPTIAGGPDEGAVLQTSPEGRKAAEALRAFFAAKTLEERLPLTLGGESMKSLMQRYYARKDPGPVAVDEIRLLRFDPTPQTGGGPHCVFTVASKQWDYPIPVMLQEEGGRFKVDWLTFVEFRDDLLREFLSGYQDVPAKFHVGISRTHYFEDDVPDLEGKDCFKVEPPVPAYIGYVFVPKGTPLAADLAKRITWETLTAYVVVELRWKQQGSLKWVELTGVPQLNWYSAPQESKAASGDASQKKSGAANVQKPKSKAK